MAFKATERGQALILITLAIVVLFAFASLAIDGSLAFSDRRHAQNAADTSALAAALTRIHGKDWDITVATAKARAASNGYADNKTTNTVEVYVCNDALATCTALPTNADATQYVEVRITSHVKTFFAKVIGRAEFINRVVAVARAVPGYKKSLFSGQAIVALNKDACPALDYGGSGTTIVTGSGIFINSRCATGSNQALNNSATGIVLQVPCYNIVGGTTVRASTLITTGGCANSNNNPSMFMANPLTTFPAPDVTCDPNKLGTVSTSGTTTLIGPGYYDNRNSGNTFPANSWQTNVVMQSGVYCLDLGSTTSFSMNGGQIITGSGVLIYMKTGSVKWTSGTLNLAASTNPNNPYKGLLLAMAPDNCASVGISGNQGSTFVGTILAPCSLVSVSGGSSTGNAATLQNQIIADRISLTGGGTLNINYEASEQWQPPMPPAIEVNQ